MTAENLLETVELATGDEVDATVIWLHGLGADGHDFEPIVAELHLPFGIRFVFPHAPPRAVTINGGLRMRAWYDILEWGETAPEDSAGIRQSAAAVGLLIDRELERGGSQRIVLAGFSQGGAIALHAGLRETRRVAGVLALSTYLPLASTLAGDRSAVNADVPILMAHGTDDPVVPLRFAQASRRLLEAHGYAVEWQTYPMGHAVCAAEIRDIGVWLTRVVGR